MDKQAIRERVWDALDESGEARFPFPPHGRIPNFAGAERAADRLAATDEFADAAFVKANPDAPQLPVRRRALHEGTTVFMAVPRLREPECFLRLDPAEIPPESIDDAATLSSVDDFADQVGPDAVPAVDLVVCGSVAVTEAGARIGKGEGYSDLEFAVLRELGLVDEGTPVATTVHELQVLDGESTGDLDDDTAAAVTVEPHDVPMDLVVTPERTVRTETEYGKPEGIQWELLDEERIEEIPVLERFRG